ncbi:MAG: hypothetical protein ACE5H1_09610 [Thermodesulfobacteriota bacterium]
MILKLSKKIEEIFENYALYHLMQEEDYDDETLDLESAKAYYKTLENKNESSLPQKVFEAII